LGSKAGRIPSIAVTWIVHACAKAGISNATVGKSFAFTPIAYALTHLAYAFPALASAVTPFAYSVRSIEGAILPPEDAMPCMSFDILCIGTAMTEISLQLVLIQ
jgi:hypothetical protein